MTEEIHKNRLITDEEKNALGLCGSERCFIKTTMCMICKKEPDLNQQKLGCYAYRLNPDGVGNMLIYCEECKVKAQYVYLSELTKAKMLPTKQPLFDSNIGLKIIRTDGSESRGYLQYGMTLGWSSSKNELTSWVRIPEADAVKPLVLSLLFEANPQLKDLPEFKEGLRVPLNCEEMFKQEFPEFYQKVQESIVNLNTKSFPTSNTNTAN